MSIDDEFLKHGISDDVLKKLERATSNMNIIPIQAANAFRTESDMLSLLESQKKDELNKVMQEKIQKDMNLSESPASKSMIISRLSRIHKLTETAQEEVKMNHMIMRSTPHEDTKPHIEQQDTVESKSIKADNTFIKEEIKNRITTAALDTIVNSIKLFYPDFETSWCSLGPEESGRNIHISFKDTSEDDLIDNTMSMKFKKSQFENIEFALLVLSNIATRCFPKEYHKQDHRYDLFITTTKKLLIMSYEDGGK